MLNIRKKTIFRCVLEIAFGIALFFGGLLSAQEPIDIVYTWVDGADPAWQEVRDRYFQECFPFITSQESNSKNRYRNRDELRYSMRSVLKYAPFFNHIYIVTFQQKPKWLVDHPQVTIIDHSEIFPDKSYLPTFNSQAIECNLHRIPNLSEKFIYFNDDVFLALPVEEDDFFTSTDGIRFNLSTRYSPTGAIVPGEIAFYSAWKNTNRFLDATFWPEPRSRLAHAPFALKKSFIQEVENKYPEIFNLVSSHRFRMSDDFVMTNGLIQYCCYYAKKAKMGHARYSIFHVYPTIEAIERQIKKFHSRKHTYFCVQDCCLEDSPEVDLRVKTFLEKMFPDPAPWEAADTQTGDDEDDDDAADDDM